VSEYLLCLFLLIICFCELFIYQGKSVEVESIPRNIENLSKEERMALLQVESRELPGLAAELSERVTELKEKINPVKQLVKQVVASNPEGVNDELVQYLEVKQQLLLSYCTNLVFYMLLKSQGKSVRNHPVMRQLLDLRYVMEKLRSLDGKLKYQIDRLAKAAASGEDAAQAISRSRPNAMNLMVRGGDSEEEGQGSDASDSEIESDDGNKVASKTGIYRPPRLEAAPFRDNDKEYERAKEKLTNKRKKLKNSEIMESLREEFSAAPEQSSSTGVGNDSADLKALAEEAEERRKFEEDRFVRLVSLFVRLSVYFCSNLNIFCRRCPGRTRRTSSGGSQNLSRP
jgi:U3 small nucleolar RNA-associated protein 3